MHSQLPPPHRGLVRATLSGAWLASALGSGSAIAFTPRTIASELGTYVTYFWGGLAMLAGLVALVGVLANRYRLEWVGAWFASGGLSIYAGVLWWLVYTGETTRLTQAFLITALLAHTLNRAVSCAAHAAKLRLQTGTGEIGVVS